MSDAYWVVFFESDATGHVATTAVEDSEEAAIADGRGACTGESLDPDRLEHTGIIGPIPIDPGQSAFEVRPRACPGCGLHLWLGEDAPTPDTTWFRRDGETDETIDWECLACNSTTTVPKGDASGGFEVEVPGQ